MKDRSEQMRTTDRRHVRLPDWLPGARKGEKGQALVEFALVLPFLLFVLYGIIQFGLLLNTYITVTDSARAGARQLALEQGNNDPCDPAVQVATNAGSSVKLTSTNVTVTFTTAAGGTPTHDYCISVGGTTTPAPYTYPANNGAISATNPGNEVEGDTASMTVTTLFPLQFFGFKLMNINLTSSASDAVE
jgi:Flp pilus assembly protein TadG